MPPLASAAGLAAGRAAGLNITEAQAIRWITANPAWALGVAERTGTLETGKLADLVVWSGDPFSVYTRADLVFVDGAVTWDRASTARQPVMDFELGQPGEGDTK